jgi:integrase
MGRVVRVGNAEHHGRRWRVAEIHDDGTRSHRSWEGPEAEAEARRFVAAFRHIQATTTIARAVAEYLDHLRKHGGAKRVPLAPKSLRIVRSKLEGLLQLVDPRDRAHNRGKRRPESLKVSDRALGDLTPTLAQRLYSARVRALKSNGEPISADTHRSELIYGNAFGDWCASRGYLRANPFAEVLPEGTLSKGKDQLRLDEARRFLLACYADAHPIGGVAAAAALTLGVRSSEILDREVRDLDDDGRTLWIDRGKTANARRRVAVPPVLRAALQRLTAGQGPGAYIFSTMTENTLLKHVRRICDVAGVPSVCTHGLRGTQISLTLEVTTSLEASSRSAGHGGTGVTRAHYLAAGVETSARAMLLERILLELPDPAEEARKLAEAEAEVRAAQAKLESLRGTSPSGYERGNAVPNGRN